MSAVYWLCKSACKCSIEAESRQHTGHDVAIAPHPVSMVQLYGPDICNRAHLKINWSKMLLYYYVAPCKRYVPTIAIHISEDMQYGILSPKVLILVSIMQQGGGRQDTLAD